MSWENVPVFEYTLPNGEPVKYGLCRTQSTTEPDRELWFVAFKNDLYGDQASTFVVDKHCTEKSFLNRMSNDLMKWEVICFCRLDEGNEVRFDELETGTTNGGYVRANTFALDSPYLPFSVDSIVTRIKKYEVYLAELKEDYEKESRRLFSRTTKWHKLLPSEQAKLMNWWRRKVAQRIRQEHPGKYDNKISFEVRNY